jgi:PLP dependent protein
MSIAIPNLHTIQTLTSTKAAIALNKALPDTRTVPLSILIQINTSGEDAKSGIDPEKEKDTLHELATHIIQNCPKLRLQGLMTIGALEQSLGSSDENRDFERLKETRDELQVYLRDSARGFDQTSWGQEGRLLLSMGMSSDFEVAVKAGSDIVRVGTGIFGSRKTKDEIKTSS